ncbi:MAG: endolytic transglycosylase MltG [Streptosporangiales bacterium]
MARGRGMNELDLVHDDQPRTRRQAAHRRRRERRQRRKGGAATLVALVIVFAVIGGLGWGGYTVLHGLTTTPDYHGAGKGSVTVHIHPGASTRLIAATLEKDGVVKSAEAFREAASEDPDALTIQPGYYDMHKHMAGALALNRLLDPSARMLQRVTVPEGLRVKKILSLLADESNKPLAQFKKAAKNTDALGLPPAAHGNLEGYLFPATYNFPPDSTAKSMLHTMVKRHMAEERKLHLTAEAKAMHMTLHQALTVASLLQAEAKPKDFTKVARVVYNRLDKGIPLQFDTTVLYALGRADLHVTLKDTRVKSPYNTYLHKGLPPGPIDNPGSAAIKAALHPANGDWLYFVTTNPKTGETKFTDNPKQFQRFKREFKRNSG